MLAETRKQGGATLAVTNEPTSPLSRTSDHTLPLLAGVAAAVMPFLTITVAYSFVAVAHFVVPAEAREV